MILACDIGNSRIKFALYDLSGLRELKISSHDLLPMDWFKSRDITSVAISSVVPSVTAQLYIYFSREFNIKPFVITHQSLFNLKIDYETPQSLGIDRICSAEGAFALFKASPEFSGYNDRSFIITVDMGTATTVNIVKYNGVFAGGIIMPGIFTMAASLKVNTAQLPEISIEGDYRDFIGKNTRSSIASGILNSTLSLIDSSICYLKSRMGAEVIKLYTTGGNAALVDKHMKYEHVMVEDLVLRGVKSVFERNVTLG
ncbi:MAG: type III pantothenate kinase [Ignavibacteria bacterium]|jgi:type III pantothenate kinase|nr:type III pantothenate kinase [Ignavibacteria bacterium]MCU7502465.1 type III pantothenate kinase [Ignavibacteria bacterium]MCU7514970.1 type III pantothenate kinase [Ignavibacteria bacterium]